MVRRKNGKEHNGRSYQCHDVVVVGFGRRVAARREQPERKERLEHDGFELGDVETHSHLVEKVEQRHVKDKRRVALALRRRAVALAQLEHGEHKVVHQIAQRASRAAFTSIVLVGFVAAVARRRRLQLYELRDREHPERERHVGKVHVRQRHVGAAQQIADVALLDDIRLEQQRATVHRPADAPQRAQHRPTKTS